MWWILCAAAWVRPAAARAAGEFDGTDVALDVDWATFLERHDLEWRWEWSGGGIYTIQPVSVDLSHCGVNSSRGGKGPCCISATGADGVSSDIDKAAPTGQVELVGCAETEPRQQWLMTPNGSIINQFDGRCLSFEVDTPLSAGGTVPLVTTPCLAQTAKWADFEGFFIPTAATKNRRSSHDGPGPSAKCMQIATAKPFCDGTVCPFSFASAFVTGAQLQLADCQNGDRSQLFAAFTLPTSKAPEPRQNLIPLTWAVSAYTGNGKIGARIQSEEGGVGVLHVLIDNVELGAYGKRKPTGYFRLHVINSTIGAVEVAIRQRIIDSVIEGNVTKITTGACVSNFTIFVNADLGLPVVSIRCISADKNFTPHLEWVSAGKTDFAWRNRTANDGTLEAWASVTSIEPGKGAQMIVDAATAASTEDLAEATASWWLRYWTQSFVSLPITRVEAMYYTQMFRFPASDRVVLHGLMGAFGPTGNFNLWSDDVWDMNEQVMYWISQASNRAEIGATLTDWFESAGGNIPGGLWMIHNYVKQADFTGNTSKLSQYALPAIVAAVKAQAGGVERSPGSLKLLNGTYHIVGCSSPEYHCYPPFQHLACQPKQDCNFALAQLRWGLTAAISLAQRLGLTANFGKRYGVDLAWWQALLHGKLAWYPYDNATGFKLDQDCEFRCPHRHFSHLLHLYDLETVQFGGGPPVGGSVSSATVDRLFHRSLDNWYGVTCNRSNWFNEECRGFTRCGLVGMNAVSDRPMAAVGNLTSLIDDVMTPNGMYGEMVYQAHPNEFSPVSESAYCGAGVVHTLLLHSMSGSNVISLFPGLPSSWADAAFYELRAAGGLVVSAARRSGSMQFVRIWSPQTQTCTVRVPHDKRWTAAAGAPEALPAGTAVATAAGGGWSVTVPAGKAVLLHLNTVKAPFSIAPIPGNTSEFHFFGYTRPVKPLH